MKTPQITEIKTDKKRYLDLLLLGDEQENMIDKYLERGKMYLLCDPVPICVAVVTDEGQGTCELKNIAVYPKYQRMGYGKAMIQFLLKEYASFGFKSMQLGTGGVPGIMGFYQSFGFQISHRIKDFFTKNCDHPIIEDGVLLTDMVYLKKDLH